MQLNEKNGGKIMNIDKETIPSYLNMVFDDSAKMIKKLRDQAVEDDQNQDGEKKLSIREEGFSFNMEEYYFEAPNLFISGRMTSAEGEGYVCIEIPISDKVLIDILEYSCKKLNKLKTALETLK